MTTSGKVIAALVIIVLMGVGFWIQDYQPKQKEIVALNQQILEQEEKYQELKLEAENLAKWEEARTQFQQVLAGFHETANLKDFIPSFLTDIEKMVKEERQAAHDPAFYVTSISPGAVQNTSPASAGNEGKKGAPSAMAAAPQSGKTVIQLNFTGRYGTIVDFLQQLGNYKLNKLVTIERITLSPQGAEPGLSPTLSVTMPFEVYMLAGGG